MTPSAKPARRRSPPAWAPVQAEGGEDGGEDLSSTAARSLLPSALGPGIAGLQGARLTLERRPWGARAGPAPARVCFTTSPLRARLRMRRRAFQDPHRGSRAVIPGWREALGGLGCSGGCRRRWPRAAPGQDPLPPRHLRPRGPGWCSAVNQALL